MGPVRRNVELKARDEDPARTLAACVAIGARDHGLLHQRDSYFPAHRGGLKLRDERPGPARLIQSERADAARERLSSYRLVEVADADECRRALGTALGLLGDVVKRRRLLLWRGVRIHLDDVDGLGTFVELEAVAPSASDLSEEHRLVAGLRGRLGITDDRLCAAGYARQLGIVAPVG